MIFSHLWCGNSKSNHFNTSFWQLNEYNWILIIALSTVVSVPPALAESLSTYCISQVGQKQTFNSALPTSEPARVAVSVDNLILEVIASGDRLSLMQNKSTIPLSEVRAPQYGYGKIESLTLSKGNWIWINGSETDYVAQLNLGDNSSPEIALPVELPELYSEPCTIWQRFWMKCTRAQGAFSATLDRPFITGYRSTFFERPELVSFEMIAGQAKQISAKVQGIRFLKDTPKLGGALFQAPSGEAFLYDGTAVTALFSESQNELVGNYSPVWHIETTRKNRTFLTNIGHLSSPAFFLEIEAGPKLTPFSIPEELSNTWLNLFTIQNHPRIWGVTRHSVVVEVKGSLRTVVNILSPSFIDGPAGVQQAPDGTISFVVRNPTTGSFTNYFFVSASPTSRCKVVLDPDKPVLLDNM
jgi:hypothetical protein